jgi:hypothetical protein
MRKFLSIISVLMFSIRALSLGEINCSDATGELRRVEHEIWGANHLAWYYRNERLEPMGRVRVEANQESRVLISGTYDNGQYHMEVNVHFTDTRESISKVVLCEAWKSSAID